MKKITLILVSIFAFFASCHFSPKDKLDFINSQQDVTDSLYSLRYLSKFITSDVKNCYLGYHREFFINNVNIGDFDELTNGAKLDEDKVREVYSGDIGRLISLMAYLNKNHISGYYIDLFSHIFVFSYRNYEYGNRTENARSILFKDEYVEIVKNDFIVKDESEKLLLVIFNMPDPNTGRYLKPIQ